MGSSRKTPITFEEHEDLGRALLYVDDLLVTLATKTANAYGQTIAARKAAYEAHRAMRHLRSELDNRVFTEYPDQAEVDIYYGHHVLPELDLRDIVNERLGINTEVSPDKN